MINGASFAVSALRPTPLSRPHPAARLAGLLLGLATAMACGPVGLAVLLLVVAGALVWTGLSLRCQLAAQRPWVPVALLVLAVHTLTTVSAAPLGHPSWAGLLAGVWALVRVAVSVGLLGLYLRVASLDDLIAGTSWWLAPLTRLGVPVADLGLMLAVALGTAPVVLGEGRRIEMVVRLRRSGRDGGRAANPVFRWVERVADRGRLVVPLLETLARRAEALNLSLRRRRPQSGIGVRHLSLVEALVLLVWLGLLLGTHWL